MGKKDKDEKVQDEEFSEQDKDIIEKLPTYQPPVRPVPYNPLPLEADKPADKRKGK